MKILLHSLLFIFFTACWDTRPVKIKNPQKDGIEGLDFNLSSINFYESQFNDGSFEQTINIDINPYLLSASMGDDLISSEKAQLIGLPLGLSPELIVEDENSLILSLKGKAAEHTQEHRQEVTLYLFPTAFETSNDLTITLIKFNIDFRDPVQITYSNILLGESLDQNNGKVQGSFTLQVAGDEFIGDTNDNLAEYIQVFNLPDGLELEAIKTAANQVNIQVLGNASDHEAIHSVSDFSLELTSEILKTTEYIPSVAGFTKEQINISFIDSAKIIIPNGRVLNESLNNDGSINDSIVIELSGDSFNGNIGDLISTDLYQVNNLPNNLQLNLTLVSTNSLELSISGKALNHQITDNLQNIELEFNDGLFANNSAEYVLGNPVQNISLNFRDPGSLSYSQNYLTESNLNNGSFPNVIVIELTGDQFSGALEDNLYPNHVSISNIPQGLIPKILKKSATTAHLIFDGQADNHNSVSSSNHQISFNASAFLNTTNINSINNSSFANFKLNYYGNSLLTASHHNFNESLSNNGRIDNSITINLTGDTFKSSLTELPFEVSNLPNGLNVKVTKTNSTQAVISLEQSAGNHETNHSTNDLKIKLLTSAFSSGVNANSIGNNPLTFNINFLDQSSLNYANQLMFIESMNNDGSLSGEFNITITNNEFNGTLNQVVPGNFYSASNVPQGLNLQLKKTSSNTLSLSFIGKAVQHEGVNNFSNVTLQFHAGIFKYSTNVLNNPISNISGSFNAQPVISYSSKEFYEKLLNNGSIKTQVFIDLAGDTFVNDLDFSQHVLFNNIPIGLTPVIERDSNTRLKLSFDGLSNNHQVIDNTNFTLSFKNTAFTTTSNASNIENSSVSDLSFKFFNQLSLQANQNKFLEANSNDGQIQNTITVQLSGGSFNPNITSLPVNISNLPSGLTASVTKQGPNQAIILLNDMASDHQIADNINNLTIEFLDNAFEHQISGSSVSNNPLVFSIEYIIKPVLSFSNNSLNENSTLNDGSINQEIIINLMDDEFDWGPNFYPDKLTVQNLPAGLTPEITYEDAQTIRFKFSGKAIQHESSDNTQINLQFNANAFKYSTNISNVQNNSKSLSINFLDSIKLISNGSKFTESLNNDGSMEGFILVTLMGDTFTNLNSNSISSTQLPIGLSIVLQKIGPTSAKISILGQANNHAFNNSTNNTQIQFNSSAFSSGINPSNIVGNPITLDLQFNDPSIRKLAGAGIKHKGRTANRLGIGSSLKNIFLSNNNETELDQILMDNIYSQIPFIGGNVDLHDGSRVENTTANGGIGELEYKELATIKPGFVGAYSPDFQVSSTVIKQGLLTRACIEIFYLKNLFITPVYNRLGLNTSQFNISNVEKLYQEFHPGQILPGGIAVKAQELLGVNQNDIEETYDVLFFTFCSSPSWLSH